MRRKGDDGSFNLNGVDGLDIKTDCAFLGSLSIFKHIGGLLGGRCCCRCNCPTRGLGILTKLSLTF